RFGCDWSSGVCSSDLAMDELHAYSERRVRAGIAALPDGRFEATDVLEASEGELELRAAVTVAGDEVEIDFAGSAPQHPGNLNCRSEERRVGKEGKTRS